MKDFIDYLNFDYKNFIYLIIELLTIVLVINHFNYLSLQYYFSYESY